VREWSYLTINSFQVRHVIAAHYLRECPHIIEIGGYRTPITNFLTHDFEQAVSVDPLIEPKQTPTVLHAQEDFRFFDFKPYLTKPFGLVLLGMDLPFDFKLLQMAASAKIVVVEFSPAYLPSQAQFDFLSQTIHFQIHLKIGLDLSDCGWEETQNSYPIRPHRLLYVLNNIEN